MKADLYLKVVLTVIAVNLTIITFRGSELVPKAHAAENNDQEYTISRLKYGLVPLDDQGLVKVSVESVSPRSEVNVNLKSVGGWSITGGALKVKVEDQPVRVRIN